MTEKVAEKKVVGRTVAIALGIICIILGVGLVGAIANYTSVINDKDHTIATKNSQIADKDNTISSLNSQVSSKDSQISSLTTQNTNLQNQVTDLTNNVNLAKSTVWINSQTISQPASYYTYWTFSSSYAGYVSVTVESSTTTNTYVRVIYSSHGVSYDNQISVGTGGTAVFPVLPASIQVRIGNTNLLNGATETVTIIYRY